MYDLILLLIEYGAAFSLGILVCFAMIRFHLPAYLKEKGKNLATKEDVSEITKLIEAVKAQYVYSVEKNKNLATREDIAAITHEIENVKTQYTIVVEELKARQQLRLAALDKRLEAHQTAFKLWRKLLGVIHTPNVGDVVIECQKWWDESCVYLEPSVRTAFVSAFSAANVHFLYTSQRFDNEDIVNNYKVFTDFPNILFTAIALPPLTDDERKSLKTLDVPLQSDDSESSASIS